MDGAGNKKSKIYQVADVTRMLDSIADICDDKCRVVFGAGGGFIWSMEDGTTTPIHRRGKRYETDYWIPIPVEEQNRRKSAQAGF